MVEIPGPVRRGGALSAALDVFGTGTITRIVITTRARLRVVLTPSEGHRRRERRFCWSGKAIVKVEEQKRG